MKNMAQEFYSQQLQHIEAELKLLQRRTLLLYALRLLSFVALVVFAVAYFQQFALWQLLLAVTCAVGFVVAIKIDRRNSLRYNFLSNKKAICTDELRYLAYDFGSAPTGVEYSRFNPTLSADFDLLGSGSLFQYINRSVTKIGTERFAKSLLQFYHEKDNIIERQVAIDELSTKNGFLLDYCAFGRQVKEDGHEVENLQKWLVQPSMGFLWLNLFCALIPLFNLVWLALVFAGVLSAGSIALMILISYTMVSLAGKWVNNAHESLGRSSGIFKNYGVLIRLIQRNEFGSKYLQNIRAQLRSGKAEAYTSMQHLNRLLHRFDLRYNLLASFILNSLAGFDLLVYRSLLRWKQLNGGSVMRWIDALSTFDSLVGWGLYTFNNRETITFPQLSARPFVIKAENVGHPLINSQSRVGNSLEIDDRPSVIVITGANMAGKSTFLRTMAVNLIMAMNGAPVCASRFEFSPCHIKSSIKNADSLSLNESYFYAELKKLSEILEFIRENPNTLVVLDEILRGTNTLDKQQGTIGLLENLISHDAAVIIATHDLVIGSLAQKYPEVVHNRCFEVELSNNELQFDYRLKNGISQKLNASFLMRKMGIIS